MGKFVDLTGRKFGRLTAIKRADRPVYTKSKKAYWLAGCDCGAEIIVRSDHLRSEKIQSCGCYNKELMKIYQTTHGESYTRLHTTWQSMKGRCYNKNDQAYKYYGGCGITVCDEWLDYPTFAKWARQNGYTDNLTIDRKNNDKGYCPINCQFITLAENCGKDKLGEKHFGAKLTNEIVKLIRTSITISQNELARIFDVKQQTISDIINYRSWKHI